MPRGSSIVTGGGRSMRVSTREFRARDLRVHEILRDVPLEDVWALRLRGGGAGRTVEELRAVFADAMRAAPAPVQALFRLRTALGRCFGWDRSRREWEAETYARRLGAGGRATPAAPATIDASGTPDGRLTVVYRDDAELLSELRNATVHGFLSLSMRPAPGGYLGYLAVFVRPVSRFTWAYMTAIAPFRRFVVYPALVRGVERAWAERFGGVAARATP